MTGNVECASSNIVFYLFRSFNSGKHINVLSDEVKALALHYGHNLANEASSEAHVSTRILQFYLTPLYNTLNDLGGNELCPQKDKQTFPLDKVRLMHNDDIMKVAVETKQVSALRSILSYKIAKEFISRNMDSALAFADMKKDHPMVSSNVFNCSFVVCGYFK